MVRFVLETVPSVTYIQLVPSPVDNELVCTCNRQPSFAGQEKLKTCVAAL